MRSRDLGGAHAPTAPPLATPMLVYQPDNVHLRWVWSCECSTDVEHYPSHSQRAFQNQAEMPHSQSNSQTALSTTGCDICQKRPPGFNSLIAWWCTIYVHRRIICSRALNRSQQSRCCFQCHSQFRHAVDIRRSAAHCPRSISLLDRPLLDWLLAAAFSQMILRE